jgi:hypothetical protein
VVEDVERFAERFDGVVLAKLDALREPQIHIDGSFHLEGIASNDVDAFPAVGTVDART